MKTPLESSLMSKSQIDQGEWVLVHKNKAGKKLNESKLFIWSCYRNELSKKVKGRVKRKIARIDNVKKDHTEIYVSMKISIGF